MFITLWGRRLLLLALWLFSPLSWAAPGDISTFAGAYSGGVEGEGIPATSVELDEPNGIALDSNNNLYIADSYNYCIRKVDAATQAITTFAGVCGTYGTGGDGGPATNAILDTPKDVAVDSHDNVYIADYYRYCVRKVDAATGLISTVAGTCEVYGYSGDGGPATSATLAYPGSLALDSGDNLYIADYYSHVIRKVDAITKMISTVAGNGTSGYSGDGGLATSAQLSNPNGIALDSNDNLYISETDNHSIRKVDATTHVITTIVGDGFPGYSGDSGPATSAQLSNPNGITLDGNDNLYISDSDNYCIRKVDAVTKEISLIAGTCTVDGYSGDGGPATSATLSDPVDVALDSDGNLYIADAYDYLVRKVEAVAAPSAPDTYPTGFAATADSDSQITTTWMDASSGRLPDHYLVMCSTSDSFTAPTDGVAQTDDSNCADGAGVMNVAAGVQTYAWAGLNVGTTYYFRIYPYIDNGASLSYKTDGTVLPSAHATVKVKPPRDTSPSCPQAAGDALITTTSGVPATTGDVSLGTRNPGASPLRIALSSGVSLYGGAVVYNGDNTFTYTPNAGFTGQDVFTYWMDNRDCQMLGLVKATVNPAGDARSADKTVEAATGTAEVGSNASGGNGGGGSFPPALLLPLLAIGWRRARMTGRRS